MTQSISFKNHQLVPFVKFLESQELQGKESRLRTRFVKLFLPRIQENDTERVTILKKHAEMKDVDGASSIVYLDKDGSETTNEREGVNVKIGDVEKFNEEYVALMNEEFVLDVTPASKEMIFTVKDVVLNSKTALKGLDAVYYDLWCETFEALEDSE